jgi:NAD(P)-dependent dehydrogenase (short-subunit alcohol dehydrogenase family)
VAKTVLVTGANRGIGFGVARGLARRGCRVIMACRDRESAMRARGELESDGAVRAAGGLVEVEALDLGSLASIRDLADLLSGRGERIDALVNNAGVLCPEREETSDGFERCLGVNCLGPFLLARLLLPLLGPGGRIVNTSSIAGLYGSLDLEDLGLNEGYHPLKAYARSKLAVILLSLELAGRLEGRATVNVVHPGIVDTRILTLKRWFDPLTDALFRPFVLDIDRGALPSVELAAAPELEGVTGRYFSRSRPRRLPNRITRSPLRSGLWDLASGLVGLDAALPGCSGAAG